MILTFHQVRIFKTKKCRQNAGYTATRCRYLNVRQSLTRISVAADLPEFLAYSYVGPLFRYRCLTSVTPSGGNVPFGQTESRITRLYRPFCAVQLRSGMVEFRSIKTKRGSVMRGILLGVLVFAFGVAHAAPGTGGPDLSAIKGGVNPRNNPALMTDTLDASMRANIQGVAQRGMDITNVCVGYARDYGMAALNAQIANYRKQGGAGGAAEASQTPRFQAYADEVSNAAYDYCARVGVKLGGQVSSDVAYARKW